MIIYLEEDKYYDEAYALAGQMNSELVIADEEGPDGSDSSEDKLTRLQESDLVLKYGKDGVTLMGDGLSMQGDFTHMFSRLKQGNLQREFLVKASRLKNPGPKPLAVDATAGMGEDSLLLAAAGYDVSLYELNPVIAALLKDTIRRSSDIPELASIVARMHVVEGDSIEAMKNLPEPPDLVLLDPMFPARKKSALIKKKFQLLQKLERPCSDETELMEAAIAAKPRRLLVKRPLKGPYLAGKKPDYSISGKAIRYDVFTVRVV